MTDKSSLDYRFDNRVAVQYDALRGHPPEVSAEIGRAIAEKVGTDSRVLELGVGTGRIALPLASAGCDVFGVDLSANMLAALSKRITAEGITNIQLAQSDITALPFSKNTFDAALAVHVLHLVPNWDEVLTQVASLVRPGGTIILGRDWLDPESFSGMIRNFFRRTVLEVGTRMMPPGAKAAAPPSGGAAIVKTLMALGAQPLGQGEVTAAEWVTELTPRQVLDGIGSRDDAESWVLPDDVLTETMRRLEDFSASQWADLEAPQPVKRRFVMGVFRLQD